MEHHELLSQNSKRSRSSKKEDLRMPKKKKQKPPEEEDDKVSHKSRSKSKKKDKEKKSKKYKSSKKEKQILGYSEVQDSVTSPAFGSIVSKRNSKIGSSKEKERRSSSKKKALSQQPNLEERKSIDRPRSKKSQPSQGRPITDEENIIKEIKLDFPTIEKKVPDITGKIINVKQKKLDILKRSLLMINYQTPEKKKHQLQADYYKQLKYDKQNGTINKIDKIQYFSRRNRTYDDDQSVDEDDPCCVTHAPVYKFGKPNPRFKNFKTQFENLTVNEQVKTEYYIVSVMISYDSTRAIAVTKKDDLECWVNMFNLKTVEHEMTFAEAYVGKYIKLKEVEQNSNGSQFCTTYIDDGQFYLRIFDKTNRSEEEMLQNQIHINPLFGIDDYTMPINGLMDPYINNCFVGDTRIFCCFFHNNSLTHYHFMLDIKTLQIIGPKFQLKLDTNRKNFPIKSFYNDDMNEVYTFYRQGQALTINPEDPEKYTNYKITEMEFGQIFLFRNKSVIARSSSVILFFKINKEEDPLTRQIHRIWRQYYVLKMRGFIFFIKGNIRIQITTDDMIYYFLIDLKTYEPYLENCMYNFMDCNNCLFGSRVRFGITYKNNQNSFEIFRRKYCHDFCVPLSNENFEGAQGVDIGSNGQFVVTNINQLKFYDSKTFELVDILPISLLPSVTREINEVVGIQKCQNEHYLAVISGKNLIMNEQKANQIFIFIREQVPWSKTDRYFFFSRVVIKDMKEFDNICMVYHFKKTNSLYRDTLIFARKERIFCFNFITKQINTLYKFLVPLNMQPQYFKMNDIQTSFVTASPNDGIYYNQKNESEVDLDELYNIGCIKDIIYDAEDLSFYILTNKYEGQYGLFLIKFSENNPEKFVFHLKLKNKLEVGDCSIFVSRSEAQDGRKFKELICGYKTININTYNLIVYDISGKESERAILFRYEGFQLWESQIRGFLMETTKDFITISKGGIKILALGVHEKRQLTDNTGQDWLVHSLEGYNYLKVDKLNFILFQCSEEDKIISIYQEYMVKKGDDEETTLQEIYNICNGSITLRELLLFNSLYLCKTISAITTLVEAQPNPSVFLRSLLELDGTNMASILSFDSGSMKSLLSDQNSTYFNEEYPIFYKNKISKGASKYFYRSAIDNALRSNQVGAVAYIIQYIRKYQNNYVSHYLFLRNFSILLQKGIQVAALLESDIFQYNFDYDEWPGVHYNEESFLRPFNESIFYIRFHYKSVFPEEDFISIDDLPHEEQHNIDNSKVFKIRYAINLMPMFGEYIIQQEIPAQNRVYKTTIVQNKTIKSFLNQKTNLMGLLTVTDEFDIFETEAIQNLVEFKWQTYGRKLHYIGFIFHSIYMLTIMMYNYLVYVNNTGDKQQQLLYVGIIGSGTIYPFVYNLIQINNTGGPKLYFSNPKNYPSILFNFTSMATLPCQLFLGPFVLLSRGLNIVTIILAITRTFGFLRIYESLSPIVTMLTNVVYDLRIFLFFYTLLIFGFSLPFCILGLANFKVPGGFKNEFASEIDFEETQKYGSLSEIIEEGEEYPGIEYKHIGLFAGNIMSTLRLSMGDFQAIEPSIYLEVHENYIFWVMWLMVVVVTCIIFLNFIIAEASASYSKVVENLNAMINKEKAAMIKETEQMTLSDYKNNQKFPKYIILREVQT